MSDLDVCGRPGVTGECSLALGHPGQCNNGGPVPAPAAEPTVDMVDHPPHYIEHPSGVECIQITEHMSFNLGNAVKYIWRSDLKSEDGPIEDLRKAKWYLEREIARRGGGS